MAACLEHFSLCSLNKDQSTNLQLNFKQFEGYFLGGPLFFRTFVFHQACFVGLRVYYNSKIIQVKSFYKKQTLEISLLETSFPMMGDCKARIIEACTCP